MSRPVILLDIDGVVCDFVAPVLAEVNRLMGSTRTADDVTGWDIYTSLGASAAVGEQVNNLIRTEGFCRSLKAYEGAREGVDALREFADVHPVTAPFNGPHWIREREAWLIEFGFDRKDIVYTDAKYLICGDAIIDDKTSTLVRWGERQRGCPVLFSRPWNLADAYEGRASNWPSLVGILKALLTWRAL